MELILVREGSIRVNFGVKEFNIEKDSVIIIPPYRLHGGIANENGAVFQTVMFDVPMYFNNTPSSEMLLKPITNLKVNFDYYSSNPEFVKAVDELLNLKNNAEPANALFISSSIYKILGLLYQHCLVSDNTSAVSENSDNKNHINNILKYIENNLAGNLTLNSLAKKFGYSNEYLCRKFKSVTGLTPISYIKLLRLEKAKQLLDNTDKRIGDIALACGFTDFSYFCRCFKSAYKVTPSEYVRNK